MTVSRDYENVGKLFANVLASKEEQYVKYVNPFMTAVANRLENSFREYAGKTLTAENKKRMVEKFEGILREIFLGEKPKPITEVSVKNSGSGYVPLPDFKVQKTVVNAPVRELKAKYNLTEELGKGTVFSLIVPNKPIPKKPTKTFKPISIPNSIHASWHSIVENGQGD